MPQAPNSESRDDLYGYANANSMKMLLYGTLSGEHGSVYLTGTDNKKGAALMACTLAVGDFTFSFDLQEPLKKQESRICILLRLRSEGYK